MFFKCKHTFCLRVKVTNQTFPFYILLLFCSEFFSSNTLYIFLHHKRIPLSCQSSVLQKRLPQRQVVWLELKGITVARWKAQFTFNFVFTALSAVPLTKRGVTSWSEKMLFSAHSYIKRNQTTACSKFAFDKAF